MVESLQPPPPPLAAVAAPKRQAPPPPPLPPIYLGYDHLDSSQVDSILRNLTRHFSLRKEGKVSLFSDEEIKSMIEQLGVLLEEECLDAPHVVAALADLTANFKTMTFEKLALLTSQLLAAIQPLDIKLMVSLISQAELACSEIVDKDIILLLGPTGSGKSTTIHFLAGSELSETEIDGTFQLVVVSADPALSEVYTGSSTHSITRSIKAVTLRTANGEVVTLCDSPGFYDTDGPEIDIANGVGIIKALIGCRSVKPVVVLSSMNLGNRMEGVRALSKTLAGMVQSLPAVLNSFEYIFTRYESNRTQNVMYKQFDKMLEDMHTHERSHYDLADPNLSFLVKDMADKTRSGGMILMPLNSNREDLFAKVCSAPVIANPAAHFKAFVTSDSAKQLSAQLQVLRQKAQIAISRNRFSLLEKTLLEINALNFLDLQECGIVLSEALESVKGIISSTWDEVKDHMKVAVTDGNWAIEAEFERSVAAVARLLELDSIAKQFLGINHLATEVLHYLSGAQDGLLYRPDLDLVPVLDEGLSESTASAAAAVVILGKSETLHFKEPLLCEEVAQKQHKMSMLVAVCQEKLSPFDIASEFLELMTEKYVGYKLDVHDKLFAITDFVAECYQLVALEEMARALNCVLQCKNWFKGVFDEDDIELLYRTMTEDLQERFRQSWGDVAQILANCNIATSFSAPRCDKLNEFSNYLASIKASESLQLHLGRAIVDEIEKLSQKAAANFIKSGFVAIVEFEASSRPMDVLKLYNTWITKLKQLTDIAAFRNMHDQLFTARDGVKDRIRAIKNVFTNVWADYRNITADHIDDGVFDKLSAELHQTLLSLQGVHALFGVDGSGELYSQEFEGAMQEIEAFVQECERSVPSVEDLMAEVSTLAAHNAKTNLVIALAPACSFWPRLESLIESYRNVAEKFIIVGSEVVAELFGSLRDGTKVSGGIDLSTIYRSVTFIDALVILKVSGWCRNTDFVQVRAKLIIATAGLFAETNNELIKSFGVIEDFALVESTSDVSAAAADGKEATEKGIITGREELSRSVYDCNLGLKFFQRIAVYGEMHAPRLVVGKEVDSGEWSLFVKFFATEPNDFNAIWTSMDHSNSKILALHDYIQGKFAVPEDQMESISQNFMDRALIVCDVCKPFENLMRTDQVKFSALYNQGQSILRKIKDSSETDLRLALLSKEYETARSAAERVMMRNQEAAKDIVTSLVNDQLNNSVAVLERATGSMMLAAGSARFGDQISTIIEAVSDVESLLQCMGKYIISAEPAVDAIASVNQKIIEVVDKKCEECKMSLEKQDFAFCVDILHELKQFCSTIRVSNSRLVQVEDDKDTYCCSLESSVGEVESTMQRQLQTKLDEISKAPVESYISLQPNQFYLQLRHCKEKQFEDSADMVEAMLTSAMTSRLVTAKDNIQEIDECELCIKVINDNLHFVPVEVVTKVNPLLKSCREELERLKEEEKREKTSIADDKLWEHYYVKLAESFRQGNAYNMKKNKGCLQLTVQKECSAFLFDLERSELGVVLKKFPAIYEGYLIYLHQIQTVSIARSSGTVLFNIRDYDYYRTDAVIAGFASRVMNELSKVLVKLFDGLTDLPSRVAEVGVMDIAVRAVDNLFLVLDTSGFKVFRDELKALIPGNGFGTKLSGSFIGLASFMTLIQTNTDEAIKSKNLPDIRKWMDLMQQSGAFYKAIKTRAAHLAPGPTIPDVFVKAVKNFQSYDEFRIKVAESILVLKNVASETYPWHDRTHTPNALDRDNFYEEAFANYNILRNCASIMPHIDPNVFNAALVVKDLEMHIDGQLDNFHQELMASLMSFPSESIDLYESFYKFYDNLRAFADKFTDGKYSNKAKSFMGKITSDFAQFLIQQRTKITAQQADLNRLSETMTSVKMIGVHVYVFQDRINAMLDACLSELTQINPANIGSLGLILSNSENLAAKMLLEHKAFEHFQIHLRNTNTLKFGIDDVLGTNASAKAMSTSSMNNFLSGTDIDPARLRKLRDLYQSFDDSYWPRVMDGARVSNKEGSNYLITLVNSARATIADTVQVQEPARSLAVLSLIFAYWTLAKHYSATGNQGAAVDENGNSIAASALLKGEFLQPHAAQVIAVFRLIGLDCGKLENHLAQIKTGEGKSVTLAVTAIYFALSGCDVDCACYSQYLSDRDYKDFMGLFLAFGVNRKIRYGTFNVICEQFLNRSVNIRKFVDGIVTNDAAKIKAAHNPAADSSNGTNTRSILLIDEVDVFLSKDFYGSRYRPLTRIQHPTIIRLMDYVWANRANRSKLRISEIVQSHVFRQVVAAFPGWDALVLDCVKLMLFDLNNFESDYLVVNQRIAYKEQDGISFTAFYGYKTIFAYYKEVDSRQVARAVLEEQICFPIDCGAFAYAEIPNMYTFTMGVTGTLDTLTKYENDLLKRVYKLEKKTYIPSVYGENKLTFRGKSSEDVRIERHAGYYIAICEQIHARLTGVSIGKQNARAVLVFFESIPKLNAFYNSSCWAPHRVKTRTLTEDVSAKDKEGIIRQAVTSGSITLLTSAFGRGTDFICYDDKLLLDGGVHVIQTFLSVSVSEEMQIRGRTARQGNNGSYSLILHDLELEPFGIKVSEIEQMKQTGELYPTLSKHREDRFAKLLPDNLKFVDDIRTEHNQARLFMNCILLLHIQLKLGGAIGDPAVARDLDSFRTMLFNFNEAPPVAVDIEPSRTIVLMDATGSMTQLLEKAKFTVKVMFERAYEIVKSESVNNSFEIQFVVYRNYSSGPQYLLQYSPWAARPVDLEKFIDSISVNGGQGNEAIEVGLWHVMNEHAKEKVSQVILIGDMPPNTQEEVITKRQPQSQWVNTKFANPVYSSEQVKRLVDADIPVHAFYVNKYAETAFNAIASATSGKCDELDIHSAAGADLLTDVVTTQILENVGGGGDQGKHLVAAYNAKYGRGHIDAPFLLQRQSSR